MNAQNAGWPWFQVNGMPTTLPKKTNTGGYRRPSASVAFELGLIGATLFVALAFSMVTGVLPAQLVLPAISVVVMLSGLLVGVWALLIRRYRGLLDDRTLDTAGVLVMFGFAAAIICDKSEALRLLAALQGI